MQYAIKVTRKRTKKRGRKKKKEETVNYNPNV